MVSSVSKVNQKSVKHISQVSYDHYVEKSWKAIRKISSKIVSIFKSTPRELKAPNQSSILPSQIWTQDSLNWKLR